MRPERFELPTFGSVDQRSIQLSYERILSCKSANDLGGTKGRWGPHKNKVFEGEAQTVWKGTYFAKQSCKHTTGEQVP